MEHSTNLFAMLQAPVKVQRQTQAIAVRPVFDETALRVKLAKAELSQAEIDDIISAKQAAHNRTVVNRGAVMMGENGRHVLLVSRRFGNRPLRVEFKTVQELNDASSAITQYLAANKENKPALSSAVIDASNDIANAFGLTATTAKVTTKTATTAKTAKTAKIK